MNRKQINERIIKYAGLPYMAVIDDMKINGSGLDKKEVENFKLLYGSNVLSTAKKSTFGGCLKRAFVNPFSMVLMVLACIYLFTDIIIQRGGERNYITVSVIFFMLVLSGVVRFIQEFKSKKTIDELTKLVSETVSVKRNGKWTETDAENLVVGDMVKLKSGDRVPADMRIIKAEECFVSESGLSGESNAIAKSADVVNKELKKLSDYKNTVFYGSTVISGNCEGIVLAVGNETLYGKFSCINETPHGSFDKGADSIAMVLIKFMVVLIPLVFVISVITKDNILSAFVFSLSVAVGLTPELLPMVITACLSRGSYNMGKKQTIVKNISAIQNFGGMDVLCVDKTGTLTEDKLVLEYYMDILGNESGEVLDCGFLSAYYHSGVKNHLDYALAEVQKMQNKAEHCKNLLQKCHKIDEIPFDYERKMSSIALKSGKETYLVSKGNIYEILKRCKYFYYKGEKTEISDNIYESVGAVIGDMLEDGMKVLAVAVKKIEKEIFTTEDEKELTLIGYLTFFDAPKKSAEQAINKLKTLNIGIKVLTGDNISVAKSICKRLGIPSESAITGTELDVISDNDIQIKVENTEIFAELTPGQKSKIVNLLQTNGHTVGFLGDGINDLQAIMEADVGISVDNASPSVKESADVILLKKDLNVLEEGVVEGRKAFANMNKYVKITASSNLGNIIAVVIAAIFLPFFPMTSVQILMLNLLYDVMCLVLPWDFVDKEMCEKPLEWSGKTLSRFMLSFGPISSLFDILTFGFMFFYLCPTICGGTFSALGTEGQAQFAAIFQTGWFLESMWTQVLILHLLRTEHLNVLKRRTSKPVLLVTVPGIISLTLLAVTPLGKMLGFTALPFSYFIFLIINVLLYMFAVSLVKVIYIKHNHRFIS